GQRAFIDPEARRGGILGDFDVQLRELSFGAEIALFVVPIRQRVRRLTVGLFDEDMGGIRRELRSQPGVLGSLPLDLVGIVQNPSYTGKRRPGTLYPLVYQRRELRTGVLSDAIEGDLAQVQLPPLIHLEDQDRPSPVFALHRSWPDAHVQESAKPI